MASAATASAEVVSGVVGPTLDCSPREACWAVEDLAMVCSEVGDCFRIRRAIRASRSISSSGGDSWHPRSDTSETAGESHPNAGTDYQTYHTNQQTEQQGQYNEANTLQTNRYNEANTIRKNRNNEANYLQSNSNYNPYGDCCYDGGSDTGTALGAAALGTVGGMAVGAAIANNNQNLEDVP
jgi:hypothetical protein